jgi:Cys-rich four helix bundle protein (predicted Tat secretion target)
MNRRDMILSTGSMMVSASLGALACGGGTAVAQNTRAPSGGAPPPPPAAHAGHHHGNAEVAAAAHGCLAKGDACLSHCILLLAAGDASMADCAKAVRDMHAVMTGLAATATSGSRHLAALAKVASELCKDCEAACRRHAEKHAVCKECADACAATVAACAKLA